jgi:hypothetical protein
MLAMASLMFSCTCEQKLNNIKKKCPDLVKGDTLTLRDTVEIPSVSTDTVFKYFQKDTVIVREGRLTMKYFYNTTDSTVYLSGKCDTIYRVIERKIPTNTIMDSGGFNWWIIVSIGLAVFLLFLLFKFALTRIRSDK